MNIHSIIDLIQLKMLASKLSLFRTLKLFDLILKTFQKWDEVENKVNLLHCTLHCPVLHFPH